MASLRAELEMLKWADYREALTVATVSSLSLKACEATELWIHYCNCQGMTDTGIPYKEQFRTH